MQICGSISVVANDMGLVSAGDERGNRMRDDSVEIIV